MPRPLWKPGWSTRLARIITKCLARPITVADKPGPFILLNSHPDAENGQEHFWNVKYMSQSLEPIETQNL